MTKEEYLVVQNSILHLGNLISTLPLDDFLEKLETAKIEGKALDPILFLEVHNNLLNLEKMAKSLLSHQKMVKKISDSIVLVRSKDIK